MTNKDSDVERRLGLCEAAGKSDFRVEIEECLKTSAQLFFDLFLAAFKHMHSNARLAPVLELYRSISHLDHVFCR
jgi:hypothetical protein